MPRDYYKLRVFHSADALVVQIYPATEHFPADERYGLRAQIRRAAVSTAANIVEGCARRTVREDVSFLNVATGSACEARYLMDLSTRLGFMPPETIEDMAPRCTVLIKSLISLTTSLERLAEYSAQSPKPKSLDSARL